jgi:hypothetical protein
VVLPTYNQVEYLPLALDSIFQQPGDFNCQSTMVRPTTCPSSHEYQQRFPSGNQQRNQKVAARFNNSFSQAEKLTWTSMFYFEYVGGAG